MKPLLPRDRVESAVPARLSFSSIASLTSRASLSSFAARFGAWARESLIARGIAIALGMGGLAFIGGSAIAGPGGAKAPAGVASTSPSPLPAPAIAGEATNDAGAIPTTKPELLPSALPEASALATSSAPATSERPVRATPDDPVYLNRARVADLRRLPGVGEKRAEAILALRARQPGGHFQQIEDLLKVKGVGRAMLRRLHPLVRL